MVSGFLRTDASAAHIWDFAFTTITSWRRTSFARQERATLIGLTTLWINGRPMVSPKLNRRRASFVLGKIDEILDWDKTKERERDVRFVELGRYLCEVRTGQYWRLENLKS